MNPHLALIRRYRLAEIISLVCYLYTTLPSHNWPCSIAGHRHHQPEWRAKYCVYPPEPMQLQTINAESVVDGPVHEQNQQQVPVWIRPATPESQPLDILPESQIAFAAHSLISWFRHARHLCFFSHRIKFPSWRFFLHTSQSQC